MATLSDLKKVKEALDAGLVSQAEFDDVKREYLRAKKEAFEFQKKELRVKEGALEIQRKGVSMRHKMELLETKEAFEANRELQKRELIAKEAFHQANIESLNMDLRAKKEALEASKECQKREMTAKEVFLKRELIIKEAFQQRKSGAELCTFALQAIVKHGYSLMTEDQKVGLVRDYVKMSGLDGSAEKYARASKRQRVSAEKRDTAPPQPSKPPRTPPAPVAAVPPPADAPAPVVANQATAPAPRRSKRFRSMSGVEEAAAAAYEDSGTTICDSEDDSDSDDPTTGKRCRKQWTEEDDAVLVAALRAGQTASAIRIAGRSGGTAYIHLKWARANGSGSPVLREYLEETCPEYVYRDPSERQVCKPWSAEEDQTFIQAHREGKTPQEIAALLPGRTRTAVSVRWSEAKSGKWGTAALRAYAAECCKG